MATNRNNFFGIGIVPSSTTSNSIPGDLEYLSGDGKLHIRGASANDAVVQEALAATLTNKTLTAPVIATIVNTGTLTLPTSTDTLVGRATTDTLTNKSISGATNTITAIPNTALTNNSITINGSTVALGGSITVSASATAALTLGTGLTGTSYNGSTAVTAAIDPTIVATLTGTQTLTNKTLTSPILNQPTADTITGISTGQLTLTAASGQNLILNTPTGQLMNFNVASSPVATLTSTGIAMFTGKTLSLSNNAQTVSFLASPSASASYTITYPAAAPTTGTALIYNGTTYAWGTVSGGYIVTTTSGLANGGTITNSASAAFQSYLVSGTSGQATLSTTPFVNTASDGVAIRLIGTSDANPVTLVNNDATSGCLIKGNITLFRGDSIDLMYSSSLARYIETARNK